METILIDTQVLVWLVNGEAALGSNARQQLEDGANRLLLSYFSLFEIKIKASIGKLAYEDSLVDDLPSMGIELLLPNVENLQQYRVDANNKDPFDTILLAVARTEVCTFMTSDQKILQMATPGVTLLDARR